MVNANEPFWSVMMPVYRPDAHYFRLALESVLQQDEGPERMQIEVVDDCSPDMDVEAMVREIGGERVAFSKTPKNLGLAGCWNTCIERARGKWVHLFHQDDLVLPGFYKAMAKADVSPENVGAAFCRHAFCDGEGRAGRISEHHLENSGILDEFMNLIASQQRIQTPSVVVRRQVYVDMGVFRTDLGYALDWEMWQRIGSRYPIWFEPEILAVYREHLGAETAKIRKNNGFGREYLTFFRIVSKFHGPSSNKAFKMGKISFSYFVAHEARRLLIQKTWGCAFREMLCAFRIMPSMNIFGEFLKFLWLFIRYSLSSVWRPKYIK
jgi:glycosyltransferase involved in cell wall biosynthesis